jgi:hypothetical protein
MHRIFVTLPAMIEFDMVAVIVAFLT